MNVKLYWKLINKYDELARGYGLYDDILKRNITYSEHELWENEREKLLLELRDFICLGKERKIRLSSYSKDVQKILNHYVVSC